MPERLTLSGPGWRLTESLIDEWRWRGLERREPRVGGGAFAPARWLPASVPGSVHHDLVRAGEIPDPYAGLRSRDAEWVQARSWVYEREFTAPAGWAGRRVRLVLDGLDPSGEVLLDGESLGRHDRPQVAAAFELPALEPGTAHRLVVALDAPPPGEPQYGRTSRVTDLRPRLGHWWDFATRLDHVGLGEVRLEATGPARLRDLWVRARPGAGGDAATVTVRVELDADRATRAVVDLVALGPDGLEAASTRLDSALGAGVTTLEAALRLERPALWWPNGMGERPLYRLRARVSAAGGPSDEREVPFGVRDLRFEPTPWPPPGAAADGPEPLPYTCVVNGVPVFLRGWNWVPVDLMHGRADLGPREAHLLRLAAEGGANTVRVWGGGLLAPERFFDLCDELGLLVWQEFPLCSSGVDNVPSAAPEYLARLEADAPELVRARRNHPSLALWCGGNELTNERREPVTGAEPAVATLARVVAAHDPDRAFRPSSPSGPVYDLTDTVGLERPAGMHDVHGPWHLRGPVDTYRPHNRNRALFHSEFGAQGASAARTLALFLSPGALWPPDASNPEWVHHGSWWLARHRVEEAFGPVDDLETYWRLSQFLQADAVRYGLEANRRRWPNCAGALVWQLNEPWPNAHNTCAVDYLGRAKAAYHAASNAMRPAALSVEHDGLVFQDALRVRPHLVADRPVSGVARLRVRTLDGRTVEEFAVPVAGEGAVALEPLEVRPPADAPVLVCTLDLLENGAVTHRNDYAFAQDLEHPFAPLRALPTARLDAVRDGQDLVLENRGPSFAALVAVQAVDARWGLRAAQDFSFLAPGESARVAVAWSELAPGAPSPDTRGAPSPDTRGVPEPDTRGVPEPDARGVPMLEVSALNAPARHHPLGGPMIAGAIDFGGTKLMVGLVDDAGAILEQVTMPTPRALGPEGVADTALSELGAQLARRGLGFADLVGIGSTVPALANGETGMMVYAPAHGWRDVPFQRILEDRAGRPARIANDVNACVLAERRFGLGRDVPDFAWVTVSTGIGGGLMLAGRLFEGPRGLAGEIGQVVVEEGGAVVGGPAGSLEAMAAGPAIARRAREAGLEVQDAAQVFELARGGNAAAQAVVERTGVYLGRGIAALVNLLDLELVVFGGGVSQSLDALRPSLERTVLERVILPEERRLRLERTALGYEAALVGAAALVLP